MEDFKYMVWVNCMTYNQASYIKDAMNGFCMQETTFPFVCTIVDDASTDDEPQVIKRYLTDYFDLNNTAVSRCEETENYTLSFAQHNTNKNCFFAVLLLKKNHHQMRKPKIPYLVEWSNNAKYYAICEGDDYWSDPLKLQKQVNVLESDQEIGLCYARAKAYDERKKSICEEIKGHEFESFEQLLLWNYIPTLTVCLRTDLRNRYFMEKNTWEEAKNWKMGDYPMWLWFCMNSKIVYLDDIVAIYRLSSGTASRPKTLSGQEAFLDSTYSIRNHFAKSAKVNNAILKKIKSDYAQKKAYIYIYNGEYQKSMKMIKEVPFIDRGRIWLSWIKNRFF